MQDAINLQFTVGQTVFVRTQDPAVQRIATIEGATSNALLLSFPKIGRLRRDDAVEIPISDILTHEWIPDGPEFIENGNNFVKHQLMVARASDVDLSLFLVSETAALNAPDVLVQPVLVVDERKLEVSGELVLVSKSALLRPSFLCEIETIRYISPIHPYFHIIEMPVGDSSVYSCIGQFQFARLAIPVMAQLAIKDEDTELLVQTRRKVAAEFARLEVNDMLDGTLCSNVVPTWKAEHLSVANISLSGALGEEGPQYAELSVTSGMKTIEYRRSSPDFTREVYSGAVLSGYTHTLARREPVIQHASLGPILDCIATEVFERQALIYVPARRQLSGPPLIALFHYGDPFSGLRGQSISVLLGYLLGGRIKHVLTETFDTDGRLTSLFSDGAPATERMVPPVPFVDSTSVEAMEVTRLIPHLIDNIYSAYLTNELAVNAIFHHYAEAATSPFPSTRLLQLSIALEALITFVTGDNRSAETIIDSGRYDSLKKEFELILDRAASDEELSRDAVDAYKKKLVQSFNLGPNLSRLRRFWPKVGVSVSKKDEDFLRRLRNALVHDGFVSDEATEEGLIKMHTDANRLTELFNRALLGYLGYAGPVIGADRKSRVRVNDGSKYPTPTPAVQNNQLLLAMNMDEAAPLSEDDELAIKAIAAISSSNDSWISRFPNISFRPTT